MSNNKQQCYFSTSDFDYHLPEDMIAQHPPDQRGTSRMLVLNRKSGACELRRFSDIVDYLSPGDTMVINNTKVMNARFYGNKEHTGAKIELLLTMPLNAQATQWKALVKPAKRVKIGTKIILIPKVDHKARNFCKGSEHYITILNKNSDGSCNIEFDSENIEEIQLGYGHTPLPPYIKRSDEQDDRERYQTVYAKETGAVAAPTAGLHFTDNIVAKLADIGVYSAEVTLHVGPGTFQPVTVEDPRDHKMHSEIFTLTEESASIINNTHQKGNKILAVGTTSVRVLETCSDDSGNVIPKQGATEIFLYPPMKPKVADMLLTNFHLPQSTLLMLVSTFTEREYVLNAYEIAKSADFKFYSYGDCMLLI